MKKRIFTCLHKIVTILKNVLTLASRIGKFRAKFVYFTNLYTNQYFSWPIRKFRTCTEKSVHLSTLTDFFTRGFFQN